MGDVRNESVAYECWCRRRWGENTYYFTFISIFKGRSGINGI
ncbi:hypothetical protein protein [Bacillus cereus G9241]|nr:hypothetical protein protein [Bacillus cereus G9241]